MHAMYMHVTYTCTCMLCTCMLHILYMYMHVTCTYTCMLHIHAWYIHAQAQTYHERSPEDECNLRASLVHWVSPRHTEEILKSKTRFH